MRKKRRGSLYLLFTIYHYIYTIFTIFTKNIHSKYYVPVIGNMLKEKLQPCISFDNVIVIFGKKTWISCENLSERITKKSKHDVSVTYNMSFLKMVGMVFLDGNKM